MRFGLQSLRQLFFKNATTLGSPDPWLLESLIGRASASGVAVNPLSAMGVSTVFACVNAVSRSMSSVPLQLYRRKDGGGRELAIDHPLFYLTHDAPNEETTSASFRRAMQANATLRNSAYAEIVRDGMMRVVEINPIENKDIYPFRDEVTKELSYMLDGKRVTKEKILHIKGLTFDGASGADPISVARDAIGLAVALQDHAAKYFKNSVSPSMIFVSPNNLTTLQLNTIREELIRKSQGSENSHVPMVLHSGTKPEILSRPDNQKGQFHESKVYQDKCICQVFGVPQIKAGITDAAHFNNVEQENQNYVTDTLLSWAVEWEQSMNQRLLGPRERGRYFFKFELGGLLRADAVARAQALRTQLECGIITRNEWRELEDRNPVEGGDNFVVSQNLQLLDSSGKPMPKPE